jgi:hypothetical protein
LLKKKQKIQTAQNQTAQNKKAYGTKNKKLIY